MNHTPGPWFTKDRLNANGNLMILTVDDRMIATVWPGAVIDKLPYDLPAEANATLIAAAPDLLDALKWALDMVPCGCQLDARLKNGGDCHGLDGEPDCWRADLAHVVAKAEGREPIGRETL
jgi:hypothetical protein